MGMLHIHFTGLMTYLFSCLFFFPHQWLHWLCCCLFISSLLQNADSCIQLSPYHFHLKSSLLKTDFLFLSLSNTQNVLLWYSSCQSVSTFSFQVIRSNTLESTLTFFLSHFTCNGGKFCWFSLQTISRI